MNNPVMYVDPTGTFILGAILGAVLGAVGAALAGDIGTVTAIAAGILGLASIPGSGFMFQAEVSMISYAGMAVASIWDPAIRNDMNNIGWNPFNTNADVTAELNKVSFYRGVPVFKISGMNGSMSLGAIFYDPNTDDEHEIDVLMHERGHNTQLMSLGLLKFSLFIGIPSPIKNGGYTPWELSASILGGSGYANVTKENITVTQEHKIVAWLYLANALFLF